MASNTHNPSAAPQNTTAAHSDFTGKLTHYFERYKRADYSYFPNSIRKRQEFVEAINDTMRDLARGEPLRKDPLHPLTVDSFADMLEGKTGPTQEILAAMPHVFRIFGDEREVFLASGMRAVKMEAARRKALWLASPEGQEALLKHRLAGEARRQQEVASQRAEERMLHNQLAWKANNPEGLEDKPSFQHMLETSHANGEDFTQFLFERVLPAWDMSQVAFCDHLRQRNERKGTAGKATITDTVLSSWRSGKTKPLRDSVDVICRAFDIAPEEGQLMAPHEGMLWKAINGHNFSWKGKKGAEALVDAIAQCQKSGETGELVKELISASGIRFERLRELLKVQQIAQWMKGAKIENTDMAMEFLKLVGPQSGEELTHRMGLQNRALLSLVTGREFDIEKLLTEANRSGNPGGAFFSALTGRKGLVTIPSTEIIVHFNAAGLECTPERIKHMRSGVKLERGGKISEADANAIMTMVEGSTRHLVEMGISKPIDNELKERCIETLTGVPHPRTLLKQAASGKLPVGELVKQTCSRRGLNQTGEGGFCEQVGISHMSDFICGKASRDLESAEKMAAWFAHHYHFTDKEQAQFIALARGTDLQRTPDTVLKEVDAGTIGRVEGLRAIYAYSQLSRAALADKTGVDEHAIRYSVAEASGGRIMADKEAIARIGKACGIGDEHIRHFVKLYDGNRVSRQSALPDNGKDESWQDHAKSSMRQGGWGNRIKN